MSSKGYSCELRPLNAQLRVVNTSVVSYLFGWKAFLQAFCMDTAWLLQISKTKPLLERREARPRCCAARGQPQVSEKFAGEHVSRSCVAKVIWASGIPSLLLKQGNVAWRGSSSDIHACYFRGISQSPWLRVAGKVVVQIRLPFILHLFFYMGCSHLGTFLSPTRMLWCLTKWTSLNTSAGTETWAVYSDIVNTQIFITWCQYYGDSKTQIIGAIYCGWSFGNIIISVDKAAEISQHSTFPASPNACQTNPK